MDRRYQIYYIYIPAKWRQNLLTMKGAMFIKGCCDVEEMNIFMPGSSSASPQLNFMLHKNTLRTSY